VVGQDCQTYLREVPLQSPSRQKKIKKRLAYFIVI
jgi:hypothetical protein